MQSIAADLFIQDATGPALLGGRRKSDGVIVFPLAGGAEREFYEPVRLAPEGVLWSFTVQRFRPKSPPYDGADDEETFKPYAVGYVELPGEVIVESRLEVDDFAKLRIGMKVRLAIVPFRRTGGTALTYAFQPVAESQP